jgi:hypothetical protein
LKTFFNRKILFIACGIIVVFIGWILYFAYYQKTSSIVEIKSINDIYKYIKPSEFNQDTLIVFDIDNTIGYPGSNTHLGSEQWFYNTVENYKKQGMTFDQAIEATLPLSFQIMEHTWMVPPEPTTVPVIKDLQNKGIVTISLTARSLDLTHRTIEQLFRMGILFNGKGLAQCPILNEANGTPALYIQGIIFSAGQDKGEMLAHWLSQVNYHPKKIIFIDDKIKNITAVEEVLRKYHYPYIGMRYGYLDEYKKSITPEIMEKELQEFLKKYPESRPIFNMPALP